MHPTRRSALACGIGVIVIPGILMPGEAKALDLGGIGASLLQGLGGFATQTAQNLVQQGVNLAVNAVNIVPPLLSSVAPLVSTATSLLQPNGPPVQSAPIFVNPGVQSRHFSIFSRASSRPLQLSDSDKQHLKPNFRSFNLNSVDNQ
jgi:hypothetical protein